MIPVRANKSANFGFTFIEILIFVTLISLIFITFSALTAVSISRERVNEHKILSTHYSEELREWLRGQKEVDWDTLVTSKMGTWCFNIEPVSQWPTLSGICTGYDLNSIYKREAILSVNADNSAVTVLITTSWRDGSNMFQVPLSTRLTVNE